RSLMPAPGFLAALREISRQNGVLLIFDEVVTGFRLAYGGAQERYGVVPDIAAFGKAISGGYPMAAVASSHDVLSVTDPAKRAGQPVALMGGTLNGNPVSAVAGLATLEILRGEGTYERLYGTTEQIKGGLRELLSERGIAADVSGEG